MPKLKKIYDAYGVNVDNPQDFYDYIYKVEKEKHIKMEECDANFFGDLVYYPLKDAAFLKRNKMLNYTGTFN